MLEANNIVFAYGDGDIVLDGVSLSVDPGERVHIEAPSGVGKTTLARVLAGYEKPLSGNVIVDGAALPYRGICPVQLIGQHPELALDPRMRMIDSLSEAGEVSDVLNEKLGIRDAWLARYPHELSGGELQRFCIARALMAKPRYLIADEISTMLDAVTQASIWKVLLDEVVSRDMGLVFTTHSKALATRIATRTFSLSKVRGR